MVERFPRQRHNRVRRGTMLLVDRREIDHDPFTFDRIQDWEHKTIQSISEQ